MAQDRPVKQKIQASVQAIRSRTRFRPDLGIILGTGLGRLAEEVAAEAIIPYSDIPHFPIPTVESHRGRLLLGRLSGRAVVIMQGRFHYYEGYDTEQIT